MAKYYMGIDIGTFESKGTIVDENARIIAAHTCPHKMEIPHPGYAEHDAEQTWWGEFCTISKALIAKSGVDPKSIEGVGCSTIGPCCLPVDENSIITADQGILRACRRAGLQCLEAGPGFVRLPGYPYGFLGGAAGRVGDSILFHGNLSAHPDGVRIRTFIEARGLQCVDFEDFPLTDIGSVIEEQEGL